MTAFYHHLGGSANNLFSSKVAENYTIYSVTIDEETQSDKFWSGVNSYASGFVKI